VRHHLGFSNFFLNFYFLVGPSLKSKMAAPIYLRLTNGAYILLSVGSVVVYCWCVDPRKQAARLSAGAVAGIVSAVVTVMLLLVVVAVLLMWLRQRSQAAKHSRYSQCKHHRPPYIYHGHLSFTRARQ